MAHKGIWGTSMQIHKIRKSSSKKLLNCYMLDCKEKAVKMGYCDYHIKGNR